MKPNKASPSKLEEIIASSPFVPTESDKAWQKNLLENTIRDGGEWMCPIAMATYTVDRKSKTLRASYSSYWDKNIAKAVARIVIACRAIGWKVVDTGVSIRQHNNVENN